MPKSICGAIGGVIIVLESLPESGGVCVMKYLYMSVFILLVLFIAPCSASAQKIARDLAADCAVDTTGMAGQDAKELETNRAASQLVESTNKFVKFSGCMAYIRGAIDTWLVFGYLNGNGMWELTGNYSPLELKDAFLAYLKDHPEHNTSFASITIFAAGREHNMIRYVEKKDKKP